MKKMKWLIALFVLAVLSWLGTGTAFAQTNLVQEGSHKVIVEGDTINAREYNTAIELLLNARLQGKQATVIMAPVRVDLEKSYETITKTDTIYMPADTVFMPGDTITITEFPKQSVDTIILNKCVPFTGSYLHAGSVDEYPHPIYIPMKETSLTRLIFNDTLTDFIKKYQTKFKVQRIKSYELAMTQYTNLDIPPQFYIRDSIVTVEGDLARFRVFGSEDWVPEFIVNGVSRGINFEATPGSPVIDGVTMRRHTCTIDSLQPGTDYTIQIKGYTRDGVFFDETEFQIKTTGTSFSFIDGPRVENGKTIIMEGTEPSHAWVDLYDSTFPDIVKHSDVEQSYNWSRHTLTITDFDPGSDYRMVGYLVNQAGDTITSEGTYQHPDVDVAPLSGFTYYTVWADQITSTSVRLRSWTTEACNIQATIGESKFTMVESPMNAEINSYFTGTYHQHGRTITGLKPNTTYYFEITNTNAAGQTIRSSIHSFKTTS